MEVNFKGGIQIDSTAKFSTSDEKVQEALEKCSGFNRDFYLDGVIEDKTVAAEVATSEASGSSEASISSISSIPGIPSEGGGSSETGEGGGEGEQVVSVADKSEAVEWLKEHYPEEGYTSVKLRSMAAVNEAGKKHGVVFEIG